MPRARSTPTIWAGSQSFYDGSTVNGATPTLGLVTKTTALASVSGGVFTWKQAGRAGYDANGRVTTSYDALDRSATTAYTPATGGPVTAGGVHQPAGVDEHDHGGAGQRLGDRGGRCQPQGDHRPVRPVGSAVEGVAGQPVSHADPGPAVHLHAVGVRRRTGCRPSCSARPGAQISSYQIYDGRLRPRQTQTPAPVANGGRMIIDTAYDSRGLAVKSSLFWNNTSGPTSTLVTFADTAVANQHRYRLRQSGAGPPRTRCGRRTCCSGRPPPPTRTTGSRSPHPPAAPPPRSCSTPHGNTTKLRQFTGPSLTGDLPGHHLQLRPARPADRRRPTRPATPGPGPTTCAAGRPPPPTRTRARRSSPTTTPGSCCPPRTPGRSPCAYDYDRLGRITSCGRAPVTTGTKLADYTYDTLAKGQAHLRHPLRRRQRLHHRGHRLRRRLPPAGHVGHACPLLRARWPARTPPSATYNVDGSPATTTLPAAGGLAAETLTTGYDTNGHPLTVDRRRPTYVSATSYYPWGATFQRLLGTGTSRVRLTTTIDEATGRLTANGVDTEHPGLPNTWDEKRTDTYVYTPAGTITSLAETLAGATVSNQCFSYDWLQRLTEAWTTTATTCQATPTQGVVAGPDPYWTSFGYDTVGDRTSQIQHAAAGNTITTYTYPTAGTATPHALTGTSTTGPGG